LLPVGGVPFLERLIGEARRQGFDRFLLLAGHRSEAVAAFLAERDIERRFECRVTPSVEPEPLGTGGALLYALPHLDDDFLLLNGDTWFGFDWLDLFDTGRRSGLAACLALREIAEPDRYETVEVRADGRVAAIRPRQAGLARGTINGGVYYLARGALAGLGSPASLEADLLPALAAEGRLGAKAYAGDFIDIGLPETLAMARRKWPGPVPASDGHRAPDAALAAAAADAKAWLFEAAAPRWADVQAGPVALFPERLSLLGERDDVPHRLLVQARHIFAYCEIGRMGWAGPWRERVGQVVETLLAAGRRPDGLFVHSVDTNGHPVDPRADLYDQAFVLLALAHAARALDQPHLIEVAEVLDSRIEDWWRRRGGGYLEGEIASFPPIRQNPHMHLLEAYIALQAASPRPLWRERAGRIADLCARHFVDPESGALLEYFDERLQPAPGSEGRLVEPGHCFEWAWLFEQLAPWGHHGVTGIADSLNRFARAVGIDARRGVAINVVSADGAVLDARARLWPQTERLKATLARHGRTGEAGDRDEALAAYRGLKRYLGTPVAGVWRDKLGVDGTWVDEPAPGSSLYHIVCAIAELQAVTDDQPTASTSRFH
jgi:mannose-6-phosphate isomerase